MKTQAIIPIAGLGTRLKGKISKPFVVLNGKPLFVYALEAFQKSRLVESVVLVVHKGSEKKFKEQVEKRHLSKVTRIVAGGEHRSDSVFQGILALDKDAEAIVIHDGARPLITAEVIDRTVQACMKRSAVVVGVPVKSTIKRVKYESQEILETLKRSELWEAQTPQVFKKDVLIKAHESKKDSLATDDAYLVEQLNVPIRMIEGSYQNIKITTPEDLKIAEMLLERQQEI